MANLSEKTLEAIQAVEELPADEKPDALERIAEANPGWIPTGDAGKTRIWMTLLVGLFIIALTAVVGAVVVATQGKEASALFVLATAIVSGSIGLFSKSPISA